MEELWSRDGCFMLKDQFRDRGTSEHSWERPGPPLPIVALAGGDCGWLNPRVVDSTQLTQELWGSHGGLVGGVKGSAVSRHGSPVRGMTTHRCWSQVVNVM